ncbi:hypothetical protein V1511DRAFT_512852 [Dipodascopsis uninucleata]
MAQAYAVGTDYRQHGSVGTNQMSQHMYTTNDSSDYESRSHQQGYRQPSIPPGTYPPGTALTVGSFSVTIEKYLSEGGFAHVYVVKLDRPVDGTNIAVLKRVAVPDKESLGLLRGEVDTMKRLKGHRHIVSYIDSHASRLRTGGYEVFLLMEFCSGGGLIDFMNTRLHNRLTESEILKIFNDIVEGVACMHYLEPPLLHRDLKVENVLISRSGYYKICDFGSACGIIGPGMTGDELRMIEDDIQRHTTMQYRSPEMVDVYRRLPIDEKSDIWALGVLLYKLCYYTTPFEEQGQLAILNATFNFPSHPLYSDSIKKLISAMLRENPRNRPNIYLILKEVCSMRGVEVPISDKYSRQFSSDSKRMPPPSLTSLSSISKTPQLQAVGAIKFEKQELSTPILPDIKPMRRGRVAPPSNLMSSSISSTTIDGSNNIRPPSRAAADTISSKGALSPEQSSSSAMQKEYSPPLPARPALENDTLSASQININIKQPQPQRPSFVISSPAPSSSIVASELQNWEASNEFRKPDPVTPRLSIELQRSRPELVSSRPGSRQEYLQTLAPPRGITPSGSRRPSQELRRSSSKSKRPMSMFLDSSMDFLRNLGSRSGTASPALSMHSESNGGYVYTSHTGSSQNLEHIESNVEFLRALGTGGSSIDRTIPSRASIGSNSEVAVANSDAKRRSVSAESASQKYRKRSSMPVLTLAASKSSLTGKFGDALRKFEQNDKTRTSSSPAADLNSSIVTRDRAVAKSVLPTIADVNSNSTRERPATASASLSSNTDSILSSSNNVKNATSNSGSYWKARHSPSSMESKTKPSILANSAAQPQKKVNSSLGIFKRSSSPNKAKKPTHLRSNTIQVAETTTPKVSASGRNRASSIQNRVQMFLSQSQSSNVVRTAIGYGPYTESQNEIIKNDSDVVEAASGTDRTVSSPRGLKTRTTIQLSATEPELPTKTLLRSTIDLNAKASKKPALPPKPAKLQGTPSPKASANSRFNSNMTSPQKSLSLDLSPSVMQKVRNANQSSILSSPTTNNGISEDGAIDPDDPNWELTFNKRFPSLSGVDDVQSRLKDVKLNGNEVDDYEVLNSGREQVARII